MKKLFILILSALILGLLFTGCRDIANITSPATVNSDGNLDKCATCIQSDSATGLGDPILSKGNWFMYNYYCDFDQEFVYYAIQAGNPKNGNINIIGDFWIQKNGDGSFTADYDIDPTFVVVDEHLGIDNYIITMDFKAKPGKDDNQDFGVPFDDEDGCFLIFAHFAVECAEE